MRIDAAEILAHGCQPWTRRSDALRVLLRLVDVLDGIELMGVSNGAGLLNDRVVLGAGLRAELGDAEFEITVEVHQESLAHLAGILVVGVALEASETVSVDAVDCGKHSRQDLDELVCGKASEFLFGDVETIHPIARLFGRDENGGEGVLAIRLCDGDSRVHELHLTFVRGDVGVGCGVSPDAGRDDLDLDGVLEREGERLDVAHSCFGSRYLRTHRPPRPQEFGLVGIAVPANQPHG